MRHITSALVMIMFTSHQGGLGKKIFLDKRFPKNNSLDVLKQKSILFKKCAYLLIPEEILSCMKVSVLTFFSCTNGPQEAADVE